MKTLHPKGYTGSIWDYHTTNDVTVIEKIQKRACWVTNRQPNFLNRLGKKHKLVKLDRESMHALIW